MPKTLVKARRTRPGQRNAASWLVESGHRDCRHVQPFPKTTSWISSPMFSSHATGIQSRYSQGPVLSCPVDDVIHLLHSSRRLGWSSALFATREEEEEETLRLIHRLLFPPYLHTCWHVLLSDLYTSYARISRTHLCCFSSLHCPRVFDTSTMRRQHLKLVSQPQVFHHCGFQNGGPAEAEQGTHSPIEH